MLALMEPDSATENRVLRCAHCGCPSLFLGHEPSEDDPGWFRLTCLQCSKRVTNLPDDLPGKWLEIEERHMDAESDRRVLRAAVLGGYFPAGFLTWCGVQPRVLARMIASGNELRLTLNHSVSPPLIFFEGRRYS